MFAGEKFRPLLSGLAANYDVQDFRLIGKNACPFFSVDFLEGQYEKYRAKDMYQVVDVERGRREPAKASEWGYDLANYNCKGKAQKVMWSRDEVLSKQRQGRSLDDMMLEATQIKAKDIKLAYEKSVADLLTDSAQYPASNVIDVVSTYGAAFNHPTDAPDAVQVIQDAMELCRGVVNTILCGSNGFYAMARNPYITKTVQGGGGEVPGKVTVQTLIGLLFEGGAGDIFIGRGKYDTSKKKTETTLSTFWGNNIILCHTNPNAMTNRYETTFAKTFAFRQEIGDGEYSDTTDYFRVREYEDLAIGGGSLVLEVDQAIDPQIIAPTYGVLLQNCYA